MMELKDAQNAVFQEIGRNLLLYQHIERLLKFLLVRADVSGYASQIEQTFAERSAEFQRLTMGHLARSLLEQIYLKDGTEERTSMPDKLVEPWISFNFSLSSDESYIEQRRNNLANIIAERNNLVHHFISNHDISSMVGCDEAMADLKQQRARALIEVDGLGKLIGVFQKQIETINGYSQSAKYKGFSQIVELRTSRLAELLEDVAAKIARPDGWAALATAGSRIQRQAPEEMGSFQKHYGYNTLKAFVLATELFEILEENTKKGGIRILYRKKADPTLERTYTIRNPSDIPSFE